MTLTTAAWRVWSLGALAFALLAGVPAGAADGEVKVTVIAIHASNRHTEIDPILKCLAEKMQEKDRTLTGFLAGRMTSKFLRPGGEATFPLVDDQTAVVIVEPKPHKAKGICLTVKTPGLGVFTYTISCEKCFPIATPYRTKSGERLIVGFLVEPAGGKDTVKKPKP